ncbi:MAG: hypothetical protein AAGA20_05080 [Planctomycetota bacterium]
MKSANRTLIVVAVLIGGGTACQTTPRLAGRDVDVVADGRQLEAINPVDIAVLPVQVTAPAVNAPTETLRRAAMKGLVRRRYSPLAAEIVDDRMASAGSGVGAIEASYTPGDLAEDAVLEVTVLRWAAPSWDIRREVDVELEARLIDPRDPLGPDLWAARIDRKFSATSGTTVPVPEARAMQEACDSIFTELFAQLPPRDLSIELELAPMPVEAEPADGALEEAAWTDDDPR